MIIDFIVILIFRFYVIFHGSVAKKKNEILVNLLPKIHLGIKRQNVAQR